MAPNTKKGRQKKLQKMQGLVSHVPADSGYAHQPSGNPARMTIMRIMILKKIAD